MFELTKYRVIFILVASLVVLLTLGTSYHILSISDPNLTERPQQQKPTEQSLEVTEQPQQPHILTPEQRNQLVEELQKKPLLPFVDELHLLEPVHKASEKITSTVFMFRGDISSPLYDLFALHKRATRYCDNDTTVDGCNVKLPNNYKWGNLSDKLLDALEVMCKEPEKTDFYVKIDDDLIMSESKLDEILKAMATTDCQVAGGIARDFGFYWPVGQIYIFKRAILEKICPLLRVTTVFHSSEDITFGSLLNSTDKSMFCSVVTPTNHWHKNYKDQRVEVKYLVQHNY